MVDAREADGLGAREGVGQGLGIARQQITGASHDEGRHAQQAKFVRGDPAAAALRARGQGQLVVTLLVGEQAKALHGRIADLLRIVHGHGFRQGHVGHGALAAGRARQHAPADTADDQVRHPFGMIAGDGEREVGAHGVAHHLGLTDAQVVHEGQDVAGHGAAVIVGRIVRLVAVAVAAVIQGDHPEVLALEGCVPAQALPVLGTVGGEAVHQQHRSPALLDGGNVVIGDLEAA